MAKARTTGHQRIENEKSQKEIVIMGTIAYGEAVSWRLVQEDLLFTEDGLKYAANLVDFPEDVKSLENTGSQGSDGVDLDLKCNFSADQTAKELQNLFSTQTSPFSRYFRFRQHALEQLWLKRKEFKNKRHEKVKNKVTVINVDKEQIDFSSRVSLLLLIPLIKSHSKTDPCLAEHSTAILFHCLQECSPNSLGNEPQSCITGLVDLLTQWLFGEYYENDLSDTEEMASYNKETINERVLAEKETVVSCLLSLACARLSLRLFVKTLYTVHRTKENLALLPVAKVLAKTVQYEKRGWRSNPSILLASCLENTWQYTMTPHSNGCMKGDVISCDGKYLYVSHGLCLIKLGSGKQGSLRGHVYCSNTNLPEGHLCFVKGKLVHRPKILDKCYHHFADIIDKNTLKAVFSVEYIPNEKNLYSVCGVATRKTVSLITDGVLLYWLYYLDVPSGGHTKTTSTTNTSTSSNQTTIVDIYLDVLEMKESGDSYVVMSIQEPVILKYKAEATTSHDFPMALAMRPVSAAHSTQDENSKTSCGLNVDVLQRTPLMTDGVYIIMLIGHPNYQGHPLCKAPFNRCYSIADGKFIRDDNIIDMSVEDSPRWQYISLASTGICYDMVNNMLWTSSENCIEEWSNIGAMSYHHIVHKLSPKQEDYVTDDGDLMTPFDCMTAVALQISFLCATVNERDVINVETDPSSDFILDEQYERYLLCILENAVRQQDNHVLHSILILIQTLFTQAFLNNRKVCEKVVSQMRFLLLKVIMSDAGEFADNVQQQACDTLRRGLGIFYPSEQSALMMILLNEPGESGVVFLKESLLRESSEALRNGPIRTSGCTGWFVEDTVSSIIDQCTEESCYFILLAKEGDAKGHELPCISPLLDYVKSFVTKVLEELFIGGNMSYHGDLENLFTRLLTSFKKISKAILETFANMEGRGTINLEQKLTLLHDAIKSSMYQQVMPVFLTAISNHRISNLIFCKLMVTQLMELTILHAKIASFHRKLCPLRHGSSKIPGQVRCFFSSCEKDSKVPYDKVPILKPWLVSRTVASMHPVSDEYKLQRTVSLFGAKILYLKFDERCATQYDYDKLIVHAGPDVTCPKVGEYSGNTHGYGGRSVVKTGWPKDSVKVNGNIVTLVFETKSTRERATPDKAVWGFSCTITADHEHQKTKHRHTRLEFFIDIALSSAYLTYFLLNSMYIGPCQSEEELRCSHLLKTKLLQRCVWEVWDSQKPDSSSDFQSCTKLTSSVVDKLRSLCGGQRPTLRPSIQHVVEPMVIETLVLSGAVKHCGLGACVAKFELESDGISRKKEFCYLFEVAEEVFLKVDCLVRQLQAMAELEKKWWQELQDICKENVQPSAAFFNDYHLQQDKAKELELLCNLKEVQFDPFDHEKTVGKLIQLLEQESGTMSHSDTGEGSPDDIFPKSRAYVHSIRDRAELLLNVTIMDSKQSSTVNRSFSNIEKVPTDEGGSRLLVNSPVARSVSAPHLDSNGDELDQQGLGDLRRFRQWDETLRNIYKATHVCNEARRCTTTVVEQMMVFIASTPDPSISCGAFLTAARTRWRRGKYRQLAILHLSKMTSVVSGLGVTGVHLLGVAVSILSQGTKLHELECGGMLNDVRNEFGVLLRHIVDQSVGMLARHCEKLILLATTPFTLCLRQDVLRSSLILMINKLCSSSHMDTGLLDLSQRHHAWRSFQVLIDRLVSWETDQAHDPQEIEWSGVARQVATVLTNYLKYLEKKIGRDDVSTCTKDPLHEVLELLQRIAKSHLGQCVLTQPQMIRILLTVVTDHQASPKHMLTSLTLLHSALPITDPDNNELLHSPSMETFSNTAKNTKLKPSHSVMKLLLNKLGELLLPYQHTENCDTRKYHGSTGAGNSVFSVFVHSRGDIPAHEIVQKVLSSSGQPFLFQVGLGSQMERAISLNRELSEQGFAEVLTDKMTICLKQATRLAQSGICVSISPSHDMKGMVAQSTTTTDNQLPETVCHDRNKSLVTYGNIRPYVSGNVAHNMASEMVMLLRNLLCGSTAWSQAVKHVLFEGLDNVVTLIQQLDETRGDTEESVWFLMAQQVLATLCSLGGFKETIRSGCNALVTGEGLLNTPCYVQAVSSDQEMARIVIDKLNDNETYIERSFDVPLSNLCVPTIEVLSYVDEVFIRKLVTAVDCILKDTTSLEPAPSVFGSNTELDLEALRTLAEVKTRALALLHACTKDENTARILLRTSPDILPGLFDMAQSLDPGERQTVIENHCEELRGLFKEYVRPVCQDATTTTAAAAAAKETTSLPSKFDILREFPLVRGCVFSRELTSAHYVNDPTDSSSPAQPRGALIYADKGIPATMLSYYWEADIISLGDSDTCDTGPHLSFGFLPSSAFNQETWIMPTGSCMIHSNGRAIHYTEGGALSWQIINLELTMKEHDVIGCGWQKQENEFDTRVVGRVFFTRNGKLLTDHVLNGIPPSLYPVVHIQKKNVRVSVNFGSRNFRYQDGKQEFHHDSKIPCCSEEETRMVLQELPFSNCDDMFTCVGEERASSRDAEIDGPLATSSRIDLLEEDNVCKLEKEYDTSISQQEFLTSSYDQMLDNGPAKFMAVDEESVCGDNASGGGGSGGKRPRQNQKDPRNALVKAWENKVFPTIRRRFRSEVDRRSGLDQIRGALMEGLIDIAISTVEDLYEDSGGLPNTLLFPKLEDIQAELDKTTIDDLQQGMNVQISSSSLELLPCFVVPGMSKTFGLNGVVQDIDKRNELILTDVYVRDEGVVVRYWYPVEFLKPQSPGLGRLSSLTLVNQSEANYEVYSELWICERTLSKIYSRSAVINLLTHKRPEAGQNACDIDHIYFIAGDLLRTPQADGGIIVRNITTTSSLKECLKTTSCSPTSVFFKHEHCLKERILQLINSCIKDETKIKDICTKMCSTLTQKPGSITHKQYSVTNVKVRKDIMFSEAALLSTSCHGTNDYFISRVRVPSVQVYGYYGRRRVTRDGCITKYNVAQYPDFNCTLSGTLADGKCLNPERLLPCNRCHIRYGSNNSKGLVVHIHGLPLSLLTCLAFIEQLVEYCCISTNLIHTTALPFHDLFTMIEKFLSTMSISSMIREMIFHILAQILRLLTKLDCNERLVSFLATHATFLTSLRMEMLKLIEKEVSISRAVALEYVLNCNFEKVKFSSYSQALVEVLIAVAQMRAVVCPVKSNASSQLKDNASDMQQEEENVELTGVQVDPVNTAAMLEEESSNGGDDGGGDGGELTIQLYNDGDSNPGSFIPFFSSLPYANEGERMVTQAENVNRAARSNSLRRQRIRDNKKRRSCKRTSPQSPDDSTEQVSPPWFERLVNTISVLRHVVERGGSVGNIATIDKLLSSVSLPSQAWERVLVVTNIPTSVGDDMVIDGITKAARPGGGLRDDTDIFIEEDRAVCIAVTEEHTPTEGQCYKSAVVQFKTGVHLDRIRQRLQQDKVLAGSTNTSAGSTLQVLKVNAQLLFDGGWSVTKACLAWETFLINRLLDDGNEQGFYKDALKTFKEIFLSCCMTSSHQESCDQPDDTTASTTVMVDKVLVSEDDVDKPVVGNLLQVFLQALPDRKKSWKDEMTELFEKYGKIKDGQEDSVKLLSFSGFLEYLREVIKADKRAAWRALLACGYNFEHDRSTVVFPWEVEKEHKLWCLNDDKMLVEYIDEISKNFSTSPQRLCPEEIFVESELNNPSFCSLQRFSRRSIGSRFVLHKSLNQCIQRLVLPVVDLRVSDSHYLSTAKLLCTAKDLLFRTTKVSELNRVLDLSAHRSADESSPEVSLDPLETLEADKVATTGPQMYQVAKQLCKINSAKLRVKVATGGDPSFPLRVNLRGEQVLGLGGAYRHFMWIMAREAQSTHLALLIPCPSAAANRNKGKYILRPAPMTLSEKQLLIFFGQLLGIALRSDIPLALDILPSFWKSLLHLPLEDLDLREADILTYNYIKRLTQISVREDFERLCAEADISGTRFVFTSLTGEEVPLCTNGGNVLVTWDNHLEYAAAVKKYRLEQLTCASRVSAIRTGLATIVPIHVLSILSPSDLEVRTCGIPNVDIDFLKVHTTYVAGIRSTDKHIEFFWDTLESFSLDQQRKFIKFACNQERLPGRCSCQDGTSDIHVPPYPMKIGPPDGRGPPDQRYIRVETCMFMVKLPRYTTQSVMKEKLLYAMNCREDPLTDFR